MSVLSCWIFDTIWQLSRDSFPINIMIGWEDEEDAWEGVFPNNLPIWFPQVLHAKHVHYDVISFCCTFFVEYGLTIISIKTILQR